MVRDVCWNGVWENAATVCGLQIRPKIRTVNPKWTEPLPPPLCYYDASSSGWFKKAQFERWFKAVVLPLAAEDPSAKKLIIGHNLSSHFSDPVMDL